jgi:uncharacterized LabA/DUF88 family protein
VSKNVAVFVDVANIFYAAKAAGVDIDYVTLLKSASAGRDLVRAYAYTGLDPDNENQRNFHEFLRRHGYKVVSKDIRKYGDGKVKANLDIELVVDMMKTARNLDIAIVVSGDGDFAPAIRAVQEQGVRVEVVSFRGNTSSDLMDVADLFTDITQIAKVEKGSSRSGRRVADDEMDLSMTEVPDKQSEGTGDRSRGRGGRTRRTSTTTTSGSTSRGRGRIAAVAPASVDAEPGEGTLIALPGEKLSRAATRPAVQDFEDDAELEEAGSDLGAGDPIADGEEMGEDGPRRRRRRGGRGRGRGRGREEGSELENGEAVAASVPRSTQSDEDGDEDEEAPAPARRSASAFGSVWDSQIGVRPGSRGAPVVDDEDLEEPSVPEYLLTERRQRAAGGQRGGAGGGRGRGGAYAAALDRARFGGGRGSTPSPYGEPATRREGSYGRPDRGGRNDRDFNRGRNDRPAFRDAPKPAPRNSDEPWSEVPPELEAMLRAQQGSRAAVDARRGPAPAREPVMEPAASAPTEEAAAPAAPVRRTRRTAASSAEATTEAGAETVAPPKVRRTRTTTAKAAAGSETDATAGEAVAAKPKRTRTTTAKAAATTDTAAVDADAPVAAPKRRTTRTKADPAA